MAKQAKKKSETKAVAKKSARAKRTGSKPAVRKLAAPFDKRLASAAKRSTVASSTTLTNHIYEVVSVPSGCTDWAIGDYMEVPVGEPPPASVTIAMSGPCNGLMATFVE